MERLAVTTARARPVTGSAYCAIVQGLVDWLR